MQAHIYFNGAHGVFMVSGRTKAAQKWLNRELSYEAWQGSVSDGIAVEGSDLCRDIAFAAQQPRLSHRRQWQGVLSMGRKVSSFELWIADVIAAGEAILFLAFVSVGLWAICHPEAVKHLLKLNN